MNIPEQIDSITKVLENLINAIKNHEVHVTHAYTKFIIEEEHGRKISTNKRILTIKYEYK